MTKHEQVLSHPYFGNIDWTKLLAKQYDLAFKPKCAPVPKFPLYSTLEEVFDAFSVLDSSHVLVNLLGVEDDNTPKFIKAEDQELFACCNYISPRAFKQELNHLIVDEPEMKTIALEHGVQLITLDRNSNTNNIA